LAQTIGYRGFWAMAGRYWWKGMGEMHRSVSGRAFHRALRRLMPGLAYEDIERSRSGVRAQCVSSNGRMVYDYVVLEDHQVINLCNAPSPAATSCLAIGAFMADKARVRLR
ncbi:MAG: L-2-hydroxyglutarate oxidase, partial [Saprospiraceae bacterium]|nr:L-2-hydroxyglutarate oxidase [Saprospiraceae bacterium]